MLALLSASVLISESRVSAEQAQLVREMTQVAGLPAAWPSTDLTGLPLRATLVRGLRLANAATLTRQADARAHMIDAARTAITTARTGRPQWGEAWTAQAYLDLVAQRDPFDSLGQSYTISPYLRDAAGWRVMTAIGMWRRLPDEMRDAVLNEAIWVAQGMHPARDDLIARIRQSPAYRPFFIRWQQERLGVRH